jgi:hypothetical protein
MALPFPDDELALALDQHIARPMATADRESASAAE